MNLILVDKQNNRYSLRDYNIHALSFNIDSPQPRSFTETIDSRHGFIDFGTVLEGRKMRSSFFMQARDYHDYSLLRNTVFRLFDAREEFYLINEDEPYRRWVVKAQGFGIERLSMTGGRFEVEFVSKSAFSESVGTTLQPQSTDYIVQITDEVAYYRFASAGFKVFNDGERIDPRELPLKIAYKGASSNLVIKNLTNGTNFKHNGQSNTSDVILLDDIRALKNGLSIFRDTNRQLIELEKGWNIFQLAGVKGAFEVSFDFRFYYM